MSKCTRNSVYKLEYNSSHKVCNVQKWILTLFALKIQEKFRNSYEMCLWLVKEWKQEQKSRIFVHIIYIFLIIEQKPSKSSKAFFERASSSKIFFEQYRVRAIFEQKFFEQFHVRVLSSSQIFERAKQNFKQTAAQSQHYSKMCFFTLYTLCDHYCTPLYINVIFLTQKAFTNHRAPTKYFTPCNADSDKNSFQDSRRTRLLLTWGLSEGPFSWGPAIAEVDPRMWHGQL